jgi:hypothetical protein
MKCDHRARLTDAGQVVNSVPFRQKLYVLRQPMDLLGPKFNPQYRTTGRYCFRKFEHGFSG